MFLFFSFLFFSFLLIYIYLLFVSHTCHHTQHIHSPLCIDDGERPSLTVATSAGKVLLHCPHEHNAKSGQHSVRFLNINRQITAMTSGALNPALSHDILMIGTQVGVCIRTHVFVDPFCHLCSCWRCN